MAPLTLLAFLLVPLSILLYRSGHFATHAIFSLLPLPPVYTPYSKCTSLTSPLPNGTVYCEDAVFWDAEDFPVPVTGDEPDDPVNGTESLEREKKRWVVLSCDYNRKSWNTVMGPLDDPGPRGSLWVYDPDLPSSPPQQMVFEGYPEGHDFHPLGFEVYPSKSGEETTMIVTNHARSRSTLEYFTLSPSSPLAAKHIKTLESPYIVAPNSIAMTSPHSFYISNDHLFTRRIPYVGAVLALLESVLGLPLSWVSHVEIGVGGEILKHKFVAWGIAFPNGISLHPSGEEVALVTSAIGQVFFYARDPATNALTFKEGVRTPFAPDNVEYSDDGTLVVAGHPHFPSLVALSQRKKATSPSWVVSLTRRTPSRDSSSGPGPSLPAEFDLKPLSKGGLSASKVLRGPSESHEMETLYQSDGSRWSSSSTGLVDGREGRGELYVVGLYEEGGMLVCRP